MSIHLAKALIITALLLVFCTHCLVIYDTSRGQESIAESVINALDRSVDPCDDFYQFSCGGWLKNTTIPEDSARVSKGFDVIGKRNFVVLKDILDNDKDISPFLKTFYTSCTDTAEIEKGESVTQLHAFLRVITERVEHGNWSSAFSTLGFLHSMKVQALWDFHVEVDAGSPKYYLGQLGQGGLNLPDRSLYLDESSEAAQIRQLYKKHIMNMFNLLNIDNVEQRAEQVMKVETALARIALPGTDLRDPFRTYNKKSVEDMVRISPSIAWYAYFGAAKLSAPAFNLIAPSYFTNLSSLISSTLSLEEMANYLRWHLTHELANYLPSRFVTETFNFYGKVLLGAKEMSPRSTVCIESTDDSIGFLLSQYFVKRVFSGESKTLALSILHSIESIFQDLLLNVTWLDQETRQRALTKLSLVADMIGYPDVWPIYRFNVSTSYMGNKIAAKIDSFNNDRAKLSSPVNRGEWGMTPETVNAYYEPTMNVMVFPAAILQNPFFEKSFPISMNYGGAGMIIGHELSHGFDDQGRLYDGTGKLENWWTPAVSYRYASKAQCLVKQYSGFEVLPGYFINGNLTLGENIADNAGIKDAFLALDKTLGPQGKEPSIVNFLNNLQLFFVAFAQGWCTKARDEFIKQRLVTDVHSPPKFRVIGPLSNLQAFADTFKCPIGSRMNPVNKCDLF